MKYNFTAATHECVLLSKTKYSERRTRCRQKQQSEDPKEFHEKMVEEKRKERARKKSADPKEFHE